MRKVALSALTLTAVAGIAGAALWTHQPVPPQPTATAEDTDEATALAASKGLVWRIGPALNFRLKSGEVVTFTDRVACGDLPCPTELSSRYRYQGWDSGKGGYLLRLTPSSAPEMVLPYAEEDAALVDARHAEQPNGTPLAMPSPPPSVETDDSLGEWVTDITAGRLQSEAGLLAASEGRAWRDGGRLTMKLEDGRTLALADDLVCGQLACPPQVFRSFDYAGMSPDRRYHVVDEHWNEASAAMLVDVKTGGITDLLGTPKFSPDGKRAVTSVTDLEWSAPRRLEIWSLTSTAPGIEFSLSAKDEDDTVYEVVAWSDADHIRLSRGPWASDQRSPALLSHDASGWHLEGADAGN